MIDLSDVLSIAYWLAIVAVIVWWVRGMRRASKPKKRSPREQAELASVQSALDRLQSSATPPISAQQNQGFDGS